MSSLMQGFSWADHEFFIEYPKWFQHFFETHCDELIYKASRKEKRMFVICHKIISWHKKLKVLKGMPKEELLKAKLSEVIPFGHLSMSYPTLNDLSKLDRDGGMYKLMRYRNIGFHTVIRLNAIFNYLGLQTFEPHVESSKVYKLSFLGAYISIMNDASRKPPIYGRRFAESVEIIGLDYLINGIKINGKYPKPSFFPRLPSERK